MSQPELEADEIIRKYALPTFDEVLGELAIDPATLEKDVANRYDLHKKGNNPPSYTFVRSVAEFIADTYDDFVEQLYQTNRIEQSSDGIFAQFKTQLNQSVTTIVIVKNTGRAYVADSAAETLKF